MIPVASESNANLESAFEPSIDDMDEYKAAPLP